MTAGSIALGYIEKSSGRRDYEDLRPTRFAPGPEGEGQHPEYPWVAKGPEPKDFLGNEFMLWLWNQADLHVGELKTDSGNEVTIFIDRDLELDCAYGQTGKDRIHGDGPTRTPEARDGLRVGKVPRKIGLLMHVNKADYSMSLNAETFAVGSAKLPDVEDAGTPRGLFEERITLLRDLGKTIDGLYQAFLEVRCSAGWVPFVAQVTSWIKQAR